MKTKKINYLTKEFGIGQYLAITIIKKLGFNQRKCSFNNTKNQLLSINKEKKKYIIEKTLKQYLLNINSYSMKIKTYKYYRNISRLPSRGQRTKTNAKTKQKYYKFEYNSNLFMF
jgi:small subunit ribosomal protein S13